MSRLFRKIILEDGEVKIPLADFDNFKGNNDDDFDYQKYEIMDIGNESEWLSLYYYEDLIVAYKYELQIELQKLHLSFLTNDIFSIVYY